MLRQQRPFGSHVHTFNYFVISCPILTSFSFLSFGNKFSSRSCVKFTHFFSDKEKNNLVFKYSSESNSHRKINDNRS